MSENEILVFLPKLTKFITSVVLSFILINLIYKIYDFYRYLKLKKSEKEYWRTYIFGENYKDNPRYQELKKKGILKDIL